MFFKPTNSDTKNGIKNKFKNVPKKSYTEYMWFALVDALTSGACHKIFHKIKNSNIL